MNTKVAILLAAILAASLALVGCSGTPRTRGERGASDEPAMSDANDQVTADNERTAEQDTEAEAPTEEDGGSGGATESDAEDGGQGEEIMLEIEGSPGTEFSGTCAVGDEEDELAGQVPQRVTYRLDGQRISCEFRKDGADPGNLKVILSGPGNRIVQQTNAGTGTINLTLSGSGSSSVSSSTSTGFGGQVSSSSSSVSSNSR